MPLVIVMNGQGAADFPLHTMQPRTLLGIAERDGEAAAPGASGAADAVDIAFRQARQVMVENMRHRLNVDAARRDIRCHQDLHGAGAKSVQRALPLALRLVAVGGPRR